MTFARRFSWSQNSLLPRRQPHRVTKAGRPALPPFLLVGCGKLGSTMLRAWRDRWSVHGCCILDPAPEAATHSGAELCVFEDASQLPRTFVPVVVIAAVKPQDAPHALWSCRRFLQRAVDDEGARKPLLLSVVTGRTVSGLRTCLGDPSVPIVRAMPNMAAAVRKAITVVHAGDGVNAEQRALCSSLLDALGETAWVEEEALLDAAAAVSGSGPAYVFLLVEEMERAALEHGIPPALARSLARQTVSGAGALLSSVRTDACLLRKSITSAGGITERAMTVLDDAWRSTFRKAIASAAGRARELAR